MNGHGLVFTMPGEIIEANFQNGKIAEGKIKIIVSRDSLLMLVFKWGILRR